MSDRYRDRPFPPDNQGRSNYSTPQRDDSDPLAELARLIGQADPFSNFGRDHQQSPPRQTRVEPPLEEPRYEDDYPQQEDFPPRYEDEPPPAPPSWMRREPVPPRDDYGYEQQQPAPRFPAHERDAEYSQPSYSQPSQYQPPQYTPPTAQPRQAEARHADPRHADPRYDDLLYGQQPVNQQADQYGYDQDYPDQDYEQQYAEEAPAKRKGGMATVIVVLALAVVGTAGAYAYRSFVGSPRSGEPPIIQADAGPNKIVPNNQSGKQIYDRVGDKSGERVVSREEQPVDVDARSGGPRVIFPPLTQNASPPSTSSVTPDSRPTGPGVANGTLNGDAPRAIKTLTIRPDQPDAIAQAAASGVVPAPTSAPPVRPQAAPRAAAPVANAPMALSPQAPAAVPEPRNNRVASLNPTAPAPTASGAYVQVSSQKSEADALNSYKALQGKYSGILGSRQATVRRADLGDKGVFYRALVGPFTSTDEATQFCVNLQSAGGKCIVQRN